MRHEVVVDIDAPVERVWRAVADVEGWPEWAPTVTEVRLHGGGPLRLGSVATVVQPEQPARDWTVTEFDDGRSFTWSSSGTGMRFTAGHVVAGTASTTTVTLTFEVAGLLAPLATVVAGRTIRSLVATEAASLASWCERPAPA